MTIIRIQLLDAARRFDGTEAGADATWEAVRGIEAPRAVVAAESAALTRWVAGHLNSPSDKSWTENDGLEADYTIDAAMSGIIDGGRRVGPNIAMAADRCMTALVELARETDTAERVKLAELYAGSRDPLGIAYVGVQLERALADMTGDAQAFIDAVQLALMEAAQPTHQEEL